MQIHDVSSYLIRFDAPAPTHIEETAFDVDANFDFSLDNPLDNPLETPLEAPFGATFEEPDVLDQPQIDPAALRQAIEAEFSASIAAEREAHEEQMILARQQWVEQESEVLGQCVTQAIDAAIDRLRADVARVLSPFVSREICEAALGELIASIRLAIANERAPAMTISGPRDLVAKVSLAIGSDVALNVVESDSIDVAVDLSPTRIEMRLAEWTRCLSEERCRDK
jgi:hypothetical protein